MTFEEFSLPNGLRVLLLPDRSESMTVLGLVKAGSRYEKRSQEGLAHFYEHMIFKGTKKFPSKQALALAVDKIGAEYNGATGQEYTLYYVKTAQRDFNIGLDLISQLLIAPLLIEEEIKIERGVILEELHMYHDVPQYRAQIELTKLLFPNHPLGTSGLGREETISAFTRKDFVNFKKVFYGAEKMVLVIAGGIKNLKLAKEEIELRFLSLVNGKKIDFSHFESAAKEKKIKRIVKQTDQIHLAMGVRALSRKSKNAYSSFAGSCSCSKPNALQAIAFEKALYVESFVLNVNCVICPFLYNLLKYLK